MCIYFLRGANADLMGTMEEETSGDVPSICRHNTSGRMLTIEEDKVQRLKGWLKTYYHRIVVEVIIIIIIIIIETVLKFPTTNFILN